MKETRAKKIFDILSFCDEYLSSEVIANQLGVSSRTIRNEIKDLNRILKSNGAEIVMHSGKGGKLVIFDEDKFKLFLGNEWHKYAFIHQDYQSQSYRVKAILGLLMFDEGGVKAELIKNEFHISESQLASDLREIKTILGRYGLVIESRPYKGMNVAGKEIEKRRLIANFFIPETAQLSQKEIGKATYFDHALWNIIKANLKNILSTCNYNVTQLGFQSLVNHIYVAVNRTRLGYYVATNNIKTLEQKQEYKLARAIMTSLGNELQMKFPDSEIAYIATHLIGKKTIEPNSSEVITPQIQQTVTELLQYVSTVLKVDYCKDMELYISLARHLVPLIERLRYALSLKNPLLEDIKNDYLAWEAAKLSAKFFQDRFKYTLTDDEVGYFALHFSVANHRNRQKINKLNILVVSETGSATGKIIELQFLKFFKETIGNIDTMDYRKAERADLKKYDLLVSSTPIHFYSPTPILIVDLFFDQQDLSNIRGKMKDLDIERITGVFRKDAFFIGKGFEPDYRVIISRMAQQLSETHLFFGDLVKEVLEREDMGSTAIGHGVATPHPLHPISKENFVAIYVNKDGIQWNEEIVYVVFLICSSDQELSDGMKLFFYNLTSLSQDQQRVFQSAKSKTYESFIGRFLTY